MWGYLALAFVAGLLVGAYGFGTFLLVKMFSGDERH